MPHKSQAEMFDRAAKQFAAHIDPDQAVADMMKLACNAASPILRSWASKWLMEHRGIKIVAEGSRNAASSTSESLCR